MHTLAAGYATLPTELTRQLSCKEKSLVPSNLYFFFSVGKVWVKLMNHQFSCCKIAGDDMTATLVDEKQKTFPPLVS